MGRDDGVCCIFFGRPARLPNVEALIDPFFGKGSRVGRGLIRRGASLPNRRSVTAAISRHILALQTSRAPTHILATYPGIRTNFYVLVEATVTGQYKVEGRLETLTRLQTRANALRAQQNLPSRPLPFELMLTPAIRPKQRGGVAPPPDLREV